MIRQYEHTECGLACLAMILGHYGHDTSISQLRREYEVSEDAGTSMATLSNWAAEKGLEGRILQGEVTEIKKTHLPVIAFWRNNHFVVIVRADERGMVIHDPASGIRRYKYREAKGLFSGYILELRPQATFTKREADAVFTLGQLANNISKLAQRQVVLLTFSIFTLLIMLISPSYIQLVLDEAIARNDFDLVVLLTCAFAIVFIFDVVNRFLKQILEICMRNFAYDELSQSIRRYLLRAQNSWFRTRPVGIILAIEKSLHSCAEFISNGYVAMLFSLLISFFSLIFMLFYSVHIAVVTLLLMSIFFIIRFSLIVPYQRAVDNSINKTAEYESLLVETQKGIVTLKANNMLHNINGVIDKAMRKHIGALMKKERLLARFDAASVVVINLEQLAVVCMGAWAILHGEMTIGMLIAYISYKRYFSDAMIDFAHKYLEKNALKGPLDRIGDLVSYPADEDVFGERSAEPPSSLLFDNVTFAWPGKQPVLKNISLTFSPEQETVIIGQSGSGKTTLLRLVSGILQPVSGAIIFNGFPLASYRLRELRTIIRIVHADDQLFSGTLLENISGFSPEPSLEEAIAACRVAEIHEVIRALPHGYDTPFIPGNPLFSAGEVQRLVLARALYARPGWLLCDEVTANLDKTTAAALLSNLRQLNIGLIFVTHSPEMVYQSGQLITLENGVATRHAAGEQP
ncbi:peptidase domain-containing ABC transporter [Pantoea sp. 1.19]|uniref:peptidase domain-containing ABC transporter n=1 Tax=Pantoea sp. 1.19 TaxID=1925589 RepID=UPI0021108FC0|nr:peptidase domain-containing ABC transporter [Pantoea sp. 1.19]